MRELITLKNRGVSMGYKQKQKQLVEEMKPLIQELHELEEWHRNNPPVKKKVVNDKDKRKKIN